nr:hypothetical protein [uncultured archaeon]UVT38856.1 cell division protein FtsW [uncultured bacterium]
MPNKKEVGTALMVAGIFVMFIGAAFPQQVAKGLVTVGIDTTPPTVSPINPSGTSKSSPKMVDPGEGIALKTEASDSGSGISSVWTDIYEAGSKIEKVDLSYYPYGDYYQGSWTVPKKEDTTWCLKFKAKDKAGNVGSADEYVKTGSKPAPEGNAYVNGIDIAPKNKIWLKTTSLNFKFEATKEADRITKVWVDIDTTGGANVKTVTLTDGPPTWTGSTTLSEGKYSVKFKFKYVEFGEKKGPVVIQSVNLGIKEKPAIPVGLPNESLALIGFGAFLAVVGAIARFRPETV